MDSEKTFQKNGEILKVGNRVNTYELLFMDDLYWYNFCILIQVQIIFVTFVYIICTYIQSYFVRLYICMLLSLFRAFCILIQLLGFIFTLHYILLLPLIKILIYCLYFEVIVLICCTFVYRLFNILT